VTASLEVTSGAGLVLALVVLWTLFVGWLVSMFLVVVDSISIGAKIAWLVLLTCLAPFAIPAYLVLRSRRLASRAA
jgi:hypothetical protein